MLEMYLLPRTLTEYLYSRSILDGSMKRRRNPGLQSIWVTIASRLPPCHVSRFSVLSPNPDQTTTLGKDATTTTTDYRTEELMPPGCWPEAAAWQGWHTTRKHNLRCVRTLIRPLGGAVRWIITDRLLPIECALGTLADNLARRRGEGIYEIVYGCVWIYMWYKCTCLKERITRKRYTKYTQVHFTSLSAYKRIVGCEQVTHFCSGVIWVCVYYVRLNRASVCVANYHINALRVLKMIVNSKKQHTHTHICICSEWSSVSSHARYP